MLFSGASKNFLVDTRWGAMRNAAYAAGWLIEPDEVLVRSYMLYITCCIVLVKLAGTTQLLR